MQRRDVEPQGRAMRFSNQQLTLWYGTEDASAPTDDALQPRRGIAVNVGVQPANPSNVVTIQYRVDQGRLQTVRAVRLRTDYDRGVEYHRALLPELGAGQTVRYVPVLSCAGREAPEAEIIGTLPSSFRVSEDSRQSERPEGPMPDDHIPPALTYLATIRIPLQEPEIVGETPAGLLVNWFWSPNEGSVTGPEINAKVRRVGGDWMTIRRDGIGLMDVRATVETDDGALLYASYLGYCDFGADGYQRFLERRWPVLVPTRTAPRIQTSHPKYLWLNRTHCVGSGAVRMKELVYVFDLYAMPWN
jgi:Protein of unknown function (DUF3237)